MRNKNKRENCSSVYIGVCWFKRDKKWVAQIKINGKSKHLGYFDNELEAHLVYQKRYNELMNNKMEEYDEMDNYEPHDF